MSKVIYFIILSGLVIAVVATIHMSGVSAYENTKFLPISVLSKKQANYAADDLDVIPAISVDILEDKVHDMQSASSVQIIRYTSIPVENQVGTDQDDSQSADQGEPHNNQGNNGNGSSNQNGNNGNGNSNQDLNNSGNGSSNAGGNSDANKGKGKDNKPDKGNPPEAIDALLENKSANPDKSDKVK
jgi:hypothetical protein